MTTINAVDTTLSGQTGTGTFVGSTSPTLVTPTLGVASATSLNFGAAATNGIIGVNGTTIAAAGVVGELVYSTITAGSATAISSGVTTNLTSISLTAGEYDIWGNIGIDGTTVGTTIAGLSTSTGTLPNKEYRLYISPLATSITLSSPIPGITAYISSTTTFYIVVNSTGTGSMIMYGNLFARRRR